MDLFSPCKRWSFLPLAAALAAACAKAEVSGPEGLEPGSGPGGGTPSSGAPGAGPTFTLPDAGAGTVPPAAAPPPDRQCAEEAHQAQVVPLDLLLLVDASASMDEMAGTQTKWATVQTALGAFIRDPRSAGLGIGLQFFPARTCESDQDCFPIAIGAGFCIRRSVCAGANAPSPPLRCGATSCPTGTMCVPAGVCSSGGASCTGIGQPCAVGGTCRTAPGVCRFVFPTLECDEKNYAAPAVPISALPGAAPALLQTLGDTDPSGGTPMGPAVRGALTQVQAHLRANPGRKAALILASDGIPSMACEMNDIAAVAASVGAGFQGTPSIPTYVIGVFTDAALMTSQMQLDQLALAGGSTRAFVLAANDDLTMRLQEALAQIRGAALACEYQIPAPTGGRIDFTKVNVRYTGGAGAENIPYVERADRCDPTRGGWYYDVPPATGAPTRILVCAATCTRFSREQTGKVDLVFGCGTQVIN